MRNYRNSERPALGTPSTNGNYPKQYTESKSDLSSEREPVKDDCGDFKYGEEVLANLVMCKSVNDFTFRTRPLSLANLLLIKEAIKSTYATGALKYASRPYTTDIDEIKIYKDGLSNRVHRCKIKDLYTVPHKNGLQVLARIHQIDRGAYLYDVPFDQIFDFSPSIAHLKELNEAAKKACLGLGSPYTDDYEDENMNSYFLEKVSNYQADQVIVKILAYQDDKYRVDILDMNRRSLVKHMREKFSYIEPPIKPLPLGALRSRFKTRAEILRERVLRERQVNDTEPSKSIDARSSCLPQTHQKQYPKRYYSAVHYYRDKFYEISKDTEPSPSYLSKRLFQVRIISWQCPSELYIVPDDTDYFSNHDEFLDDLETNQDKFDQTSKIDYSKQRFDVGQRCLCRDHRDMKLGKWLRAVVLEVRGTGPDGLINRDGLMTGSVHGSELGRDTLDTMYRLRSIDYGLEYIRSAVNMRHIHDVQMFKSKGTWSLRCRLYGISPIDSDDKQRGHSSRCLLTMNTWLADRLVDKSTAVFSVLFRNTLSFNLQDPLDPYVAITLLNPFKPYSLNNDYLLPLKRRVKFHCLNTRLIDEGLVKDEDIVSGSTSSVELDEYLINKLVPLDMIEIK